jgi:single-strand DNA-binding protein
VRDTQDGSPIVTLNIATSESWKDRQSGERKEKTEWHRVVIFNENLCKVAESYLKKGAKVYIEGALQTRKWTDKDGQEKYSTEVVLQRFRGELTMLDGRGEGGGFGGGGDDFADDQGSYNAPKSSAGSSSGRASAGASVGGGAWADLDDEIPF